MHDILIHKNQAAGADAVDYATLAANQIANPPTLESIDLALKTTIGRVEELERKMSIIAIHFGRL